jgi:prophage maintenance system killer protein
VEVIRLARNRCSYEKRAKEIARKQKQEEKIKRRQNKAQAKATEDTFETETLETEALENGSVEEEESG